MSLFQTDPTQQWTILIKSLREAQMASISAKAALEKATSLSCGPLRPICSPFGRLDGAIYDFTAYTPGGSLQCRFHAERC